MNQKLLFLLFVIGFNFSITAQLSDLHYLPPLKQGQNNQGIREQAIHLSTPETTPITVNVYRGTSTGVFWTSTISNTAPAVIDAGDGLTDGDNNITLVNNSRTGVVLTDAGLRFESTGGEKFYVNYRGQSTSQAASLTAKGREAIGTDFRWGGVPNLGAHSSKSNTLGIMATEANTTVTLSGYDPDITFRQGNNADAITANTYTITLNANESFVFENYVGTRNIPSHIDGWLGATIVSDKDIVISNGGINYGAQAGASNRDAGIDQPVPVNNIGKDYVFVRGNGNDTTEFPLIIATADNTNIQIGGVTVATIDNGEYYKIPGSFYSGTTVGSNMYVYTTKDTYAYQDVAGSVNVYTQGLNFVAPVNCLLPDVMNNIPDIRNIAGTTVTGGLTITAAVNTPDANIEIYENGVLIPTPASSTVAGTSDWKTIFVPNLDGDISVQSTGPMAVGFFGYNGAQGVAGYFSGFDTVPEVILDIASGSIGDCFSDANIFVATENFDAYQWYYEGAPIDGANSLNHSDTRAGDYFVRGTKGPCTYDSDPVAIFYCDSDVSIIKSVADPEIVEGETTIFTIRAENFGFEDITNLQITDNLPAELTLVSAFTNTGSWNGTVWNIGTLEPGTPVFLELTVRGNEIDIEALINVTNTVTHTQDQIDANLSEDILSANVIVHNDFDNDGVIDIVDLDDDNDGVYDTDECTEYFCFESIINESFEDPILTSNYQILNETAVPGWLTTATDSRIELWRSGFLGVDSYDGNQHAELNANRFGALYQNLCLTPGTVMNWSLRHRARSSGGVDEMQLRIGADLASATVQQTMATDNTAWVLYSGTYTVPLGQNNTAFIFEAISTASGSISVGNFIDDINISVAVPPTCTDSDGDGYPNNIDLDSDGDGCTDADEWYRDNNADADDGGEYGSGAPVVDPTDGTVIAASYVEVLAPEILLENTSEDLGGTDINGQDVSLGDTFNYVLRFQNTGDDNATNYTIRNILPANVTLNNVDITGADPSVTFSHDPVTNIITFQIPNNLVEIGDPEYNIRMSVTLSGNCSDFINACSDTLENIAYSTFRGETNGNTFSDEPGSTNVPVCSPAPPVATNSINDLTNCNIARTVQLCGEDGVLTAGAGFTNYTWAIDTNGNGQIDAAEPAINDGDPDGDPSTLLITSIGNYIVEKSGATGCTDLVELITVELFGSTQTNPIIEFFNQVNGDANPDNDIQGEIVVCSIDGRELPQIFLCGENDNASIQLGITDADSIVWQQLDEASCDDVGDDCANRNSECTWTDLAVQDNYTVTDEGKYRIIINYNGGCFSRFYFNVFKNTLDFTVPTPTDIICGTPGNIRVTGVGSGYGFQLVDVNANNIVVPFLADNGPSFDITTSGSYKVQITQLDPITGDPIDGACIFETDPIGILERNYEVNITTVAADCSGFGEINVQALNVLPDYYYYIYLADGVTELQSPALNDNDNNHTFTSVPPGDYVIVTTTDDGCTDTQNITVDEIPELDLSASVTENITCNAGLINLTPSGGDPDPDYRMAIWSINGIDQYTSTTDALATATFQNTNDFLFPTSADAGDYVFIVFDSNDCFDFSNSVTIQDLGTVSISATNTPITCSGNTSATLTVTATGGTAPYEYSLDGTNFQTTNSFPNLGGGDYTITVRDSSGTLVSRCVESIPYKIDEPFRLTASATIVEDLACDPNGTLVKILNASGGQAPYEYSFDGGSNFDGNNERILAAGTYQLALRDNLGCTFDMEITVPNAIADPALSLAIDYNCIGEGSITVNTSNTTDFNYTYSLDGGTTTQTTNIFNNLPAGSQTVTVGYASALTPNQSTLFFENFGAGSEIQVAEAGSVYCFEPQDGTANSCNRGPVGILVNGEYTVTNAVTNTNPVLRSPQDHTGLTDGRFFAIDISTFSDTGVPQPNNILWSKSDLEVLPNQDITVTFWAYNLMRNTQTDPAYVNPEVLVEILDNTGTVIHSEVAPEIPKNTNDLDWHQRPITFNPGTNTDIDIVFRTNRNDDTGNDLILDDIMVSQLPEVCEKTQDLSTLIEDNQAFEATLLNEIDPSCNGVSDGAIRFEVSNFDVTTGYEYSVDGGINWIPETSSSFTTPATLGDGNYTVQIRRANDNTCVVDFTASLTAPTTIIPDLQLTAAFTCFNTGATLDASATEGTPSYEYQLELAAGGIERGYQTNTTFTNVPVGDYLIRVRDNNNCEVLLPLADAVTVDAPETITFDTTATACYSGASDGSIVVDVTSGNTDYTFRITRQGGTVGAWLTPNVATPSTFTFAGLTNGTYDVEVDDAFGCGPVLVTVDINSELTSNATLQSDLTCTDNAVINLNTTGGSGTYSYEWSNTNAGPWNTTGFTGNTFATGTAGTYFFRVADTTTPTACTLVTNSIAVSTADTPVITSITPTALSCNGDDTGSLAIVIDTSVGLAPYTINVLNTTTGFDYGDQTTSLAAGDYTITVTDGKNCSVTGPTTITEPSIIVSNLGSTNLTCTASGTVLGTITVNASGGTADYIYRVNNVDFSVNDTYDTSSGTNDYTFTGLDFGDYTVTITDSNNCEIIQTVTITTGPDVLVTTQGASGCTPGSGEMLVEAQASNGTLGVGNFYFAIFPAPAFNAADPAWYAEDPLPASDNTHLFTGLTPGVTYTFVVHDTSTNCEYVQEATVPVSTTSNLNAVIDDVTAITCNGFADGMVEFTISGYDATSVGYEIFASVTNVSTGIVDTMTGAVGGPETEIVNSLAPGEFYILFTENNGPNTGCVSTSDSFVIEQAPTLLAVTANATKNQNCNELGTITASGNFGVGPYEYQFLPVATTPPTTASTAWITNTVANVTAGDYIVYILDANNCIQSTPVTVGSDTAPEINTITVVDFCAVNGSYEAEVTLTTPDTATYNLSINGGSPTSFNFIGGVATVTGLSESASIQTIALQDVNGCGNTENFEISPKFQATAQLTKLLDCSGSPNPEINITGFDGYGPFEYEITGPVSQARTAIPNPANSVVWDGTAPAVIVTPGTYTVSVYDTGAATCPPKTFIIEVEGAVAPDFSETHIDAVCNGGLGSISLVQNNNGISPLTYSISPAISLPAAFNATTQTYENLPADTYTITATGTNGCTTDVIITIDEPTAIILTSPTVVEFGCSSGNSNNNATITITGATGGSGVFTRYRFFRTDDPATAAIEPDAPLQDTASDNYAETDFNGGYYGIEVFDDKGCSEIVNARILPFDELQSASIHIVDPMSCTSSDEDITIDAVSSITNFTANATNYEFRLLPSTSYNSPGDSAFNNLAVGTHTFGIRNIATGCEIFIEHIVEDPNTFDIVVNKLADVICFGDDGSIEISFTDATYTGDYEWEVLNADGTATTRTDDEGTFTGNGTTTAIPVAAGSFMVRVIQDGFPECTQERFVTITTPPAAIAPGTIDLSSVSCSNDQGTAQIIPTGGVAPYDITIEHVPSGTLTTVTGVNGHLFTGLSEGSYNVTISDSNTNPSSCTQVFTNEFSLVQPEDINGVADVVGIECSGDTDGSVTFNTAARNTAPDTPAYSYSLNTYDTAAGTSLLRNSVSQTNPDFNNLGAGFYSISVTDDLGCAFETAIVEIVDPTDVDALLVLDGSLDCGIGADLLLMASGGTGPYEWSEDGTNFNAMNNLGGTDTHLFENVPLGASYNYYIRDSFDCKSIISNTVTINPIEDLTITLDTSAAAVNCSGESTALIIAEADGAFGDYQYALATDAAFTIASIIRPNQANGIFADIPAGNYYVRVLSRSCEEITAVITIDDPSPLIIDPVITEITCADATDGSITLNVSGGNGDYIYAISPNLNKFDNVNVFDELAAGDYTVIAQDGNGCFEVIEFTLIAPEQLEMTYVSTPEICAGDEDGTITLTITGGTAPYSTSLDSNDDGDFVEDRLDFSGLASGSYLIFVRDANGCTINEVIEIEAGENLNAVPEVIYECSGDTPNNRLALTFEDPSVLPDVLYGLDTDDPNQFVFDSNFENIAPGMHFITIAHANGCINTLEFEVEQFEPLELTAVQQNLNEITAITTGGKEGYTFYFDGVDNGDKDTFYITRTDTYEVRVVDENGCEAVASIFMEFIDIEIPNFFTPDGDGQNDVWLPRNIEQFPQIWIHVFDRYGRQVYRLEDSPSGWDGFYQENTLPTGDYWYIIKLNGAEDTREFIGHFTLYR